jgi:phage antirepressor YoqD-like protein
MNEPEVGGSRFMTLQEIADATGAAYSTVAGYAQRAGWTENGKTTRLDEERATIILEAMKKPASSGAKSNLLIQMEGTETGQSLELQIAIEAKKLESLYQKALEREKAKRIEAENQVAELKPKTETLDKITATGSDVSVRELAAVLALPRLGQNNLFLRLREDGYIDGFNRPYRQHIENGLLYEKEYYVAGLNTTKTQLRVTQKGVAHFAKKYAEAAV